MKLVNGLEYHHQDSHYILQAWIYITFTPVLGLVVPAGLLFLLWLLLTADHGIGWALLSWAEFLAEWIQTDFSTVSSVQRP